MTRRILFLTGTRADFGKLKPLIEAAAASPALDPYIFATGMHTLARYGGTYDEIRKCGFENIFLHINQMAEHGGAMDLVLARTIDGLSHYLREFRPDLIVVHGDRVETLAGAITGALNNILVAHVEGGELSGTVDELIRHAVTKLAHGHFVANVQARRRLLQMGENESSIFVIGSPDVDVMLSGALPSLEQAKARYEIGFEDYAILAYHPVTTESACARLHARALVNAVRSSGWNFIAVYPNNDPGSNVILEGFAALEGNPCFRFFPSIRFEYFLTLLKHAKAIVGNSSAGVREAPVYGVPTVNIGSRQHRRYRYPTIMDVPEDEAAILGAMRQLPCRGAPSQDFGDGQSARRFAEVLQRSEFWERPVQKQFEDLHLSMAAL